MNASLWLGVRGTVDSGCWAIPPVAGWTQRRANGLELSCPAARATVHCFSYNLASKASPTFRPPAGSAAASCYAERALLLIEVLSMYLR
jgi:hypothetical protein